MIDDPMVIGESVGYIQNDHVNAECAVKRTASRLRGQFSRMNDPYFRERVRDIDDIERRYLKILVGNDDNPHLELKSPAIVIADDLHPKPCVSPVNIPSVSRLMVARPPVMWLCWRAR